MTRKSDLCLKRGREMLRIILLKGLLYTRFKCSKVNVTIHYESFYFSKFILKMEAHLMIKVALQGPCSMC